MEYPKIIVCVLSLLFVLLVIYKVYRSRWIGAWEEKKVATVLSFLGKKYRVFNDVLIADKEGRTAQIDHVIVSRYGVFVVETKNYKGSIYGTEYADRWTQAINGSKYEIPNPIKQNRGHMAVLWRVLPKFADEQYVPIVVCSSRTSLNVTLYHDLAVVTPADLLTTIKRRGRRILSREEVDTLCAVLEQKCIKDKGVLRKHVSGIRKRQKEYDRSVRKGYCPRCGAKLVLREGQHGSFYGCSNYPDCKFTKPV